MTDPSSPTGRPPSRPAPAIIGPLVALLVAVLVASGCRTNRFGKVSSEEAAEQLALARADRDRGRGDLAFLRTQAVWQARGLAPEDRNAAEALLRETTPSVNDPELDGEELIDLAKLDLPRRIKVELWVGGARRLLEEGERLESYREIKKLEEAVPLHSLRDAAADVVAQAGFSLLRDNGRYFLFFRYRESAPEVLEYLILTFPSSRHCPPTYAALAQLYEDENDWIRAIERNQELVLYHPTSPLAVYSEARIPFLRLQRVRRADYDRGEFETAQTELVDWLARHPGHELEESVRTLLLETRRRLIDNDLVVARFYDKVDKPFGTRFHAERALALARQLGDAERQGACRELLAAVGAERGAEERTAAAAPPAPIPPERDPTPPGAGR